MRLDYETQNWIKMNKKLIYALVLICGMALGTGIVGFFDKKESEKTSTELIETNVWTCSVHPEVKQEEPGLCPVCHMELTTLE